MKILKHDVIEYAKEVDYLRYKNCETCKHYGRCYVCGDCRHGSKYTFEWKRYLSDNEDDIRKYYERR